MLPPFIRSSKLPHSNSKGLRLVLRLSVELTEIVYLSTRLSSKAIFNAGFLGPFHPNRPLYKESTHLLSSSMDKLSLNVETSLSSSLLLDKPSPDTKYSS